MTEDTKVGAFCDWAENPEGETSLGSQGDQVPSNDVPPGASRDGTRQCESAPHLLPTNRKLLKGGTHTPKEALERLNSHYFIGKTDQQIGIFRIKKDGRAVFTPPDQFKLDICNVFVRLSNVSGKLILISAEKFWKENPQRHERKIVFKPGVTTDEDEFNLWVGFAVEPRQGWQKQRRLMRHIWEIICRRDKRKFKDLVRWLAWTVQNPGEKADTVVVLQSRKEGTGKSTLGWVMLEIFGPHHGVLIDDKDRLLGRFNDWLETTSFVLAEEMLWAGDRKAADKFKSMVTAQTLLLERKNGGVWPVENRLHFMLTTNHEHAFVAGVGDRRYKYYEVSEERANDKTWFGPLYQDLNKGGTAEFLHFLLRLKLESWHPREMLKTAETIEQQRMSGDSFSQWSQACIDADAIVGDDRMGWEKWDLGQRISTEHLRKAYAGFCRQHGLRAANNFGNACADMLGKRVRLPLQGGPDIKAIDSVGTVAEEKKHRPWGYEIPDGDEWQKRLEMRLGITNNKGKPLTSKSK